MDTLEAPTRTSQTSVLPSIQSSHFNLAENDLIENFGNDSDEEHEVHKIRQPGPGAVKPDRSEDTDSLNEYLSNIYNSNHRVFLILFCCITVITVTLLSMIAYILINWLRGFTFHPDSPSDDDYNVHLIVMILGALLLPAYGMLIFRVFPRVPYATLVNYHIAIHVVGLILIVFGIKVAYDAHHLYAKTHLYSLHSWFGFTIFILQFFQLVTGNWLYFRDFPQPIMKYCHTVAGTIIFLWSGAAVSSGLMYRATLILKNRVSSDDPSGRIQNRIQLILNVFGMLATMFAVLVRYLCSEYRFSRAALPQKDADNKENRLGDANPFAQDTFEYGAARKSIHVDADAMEEFVRSLNKDDKDGLGMQFEGTSIYYGAIKPGSPISRKSVTEELMRLTQKRESRARESEAGQSSSDTARQSSVFFLPSNPRGPRAYAQSSNHEQDKVD